MPQPAQQDLAKIAPAFGNPADPLEAALAAKARDGAAGGMRARVVAAGEDWRALDILCTAGPDDPAFEEMHDRSSVSVVLAGTFHYRVDDGSALMAPGAMLLGDQGRCFTCGHEHGEGDRCISFQFGPGLLERIAADAGALRSTFAAPRLPPSRGTAALVARAAQALTDPSAAEEIALALAGAALRVERDVSLPHLAARDVARAAAAARGMEATPHAPHTIARLARAAGLSPFRFLRAFKAAVGASPHQFLLRLRLADAARRLLDTREAVTAIAYEVGFDDLSNFTRAFRAEFGMSPGAWRRRSGRP
jgi:AraC family transcriptional regulator